MGIFVFSSIMNKRVFTTLLLVAHLILLSAGESIAQGNDNWQLGSNGLGVHFDNGTPPYLTMDGYTPYGWSGCGVLNNQTSGNLVFYTDGQNIIDRSHQIMPQGDGLIGGNSTHGTGKICSRIGYPGQYYVFSISTATESSDIGSIYYTVVDTTLAGNGTEDEPLGDVVPTEKNVWLHDGVSEALELIKGEDGKIWMLSPRFYEPLIDIFLIDSAGINLSSSFDFGYSLVDVQAIRFCPINNKLALGSFGESDPILIFDFDPIDGTLGTPIEVPGSFGNSSNQYAGVIDLEWSPDGTKLYISKYRGYSPLSGGKLFQFDMDSPLQDAVLLHQISSTNSHVAKGLRLGPDGKIYWLYVNPETGATDHIAAILNPNETDSACNLDLTYITADTNLNYTNLFPCSAVEFKDRVPNSIEQNSPAESTLLLFPQPTHDLLTVRLNSSFMYGLASYSISSNEGSVISKTQVTLQNNQFTLDIQGLAAGVYTLTLFAGNEKINGKFIKT